MLPSRLSLIALLLGVSCAPAPAAAPLAPSGTRPAADLIIRHARVYTVNPAQPEAEAVAVLDGRIVAVGSDASADAWRGPRTRVVDANGKRLVPGFNDAHVHFIEGGLSLARVPLNDATSVVELARRIGETAARTPKGEWVQGFGWDESKWSPPALPTRQTIDAVVPDHPVSILRYDGHELVANSRALALAGITAETPDPPGGEIVRDAAGRPTGVLKDAAEALVEKVVPPLTHEQRRRAIERALAEAASHGVTSIQDMGWQVTGDTIAVYAELAREGKLTARVYAAMPIAGVEDEARLGFGRAFGQASLRLGALKAFADGSLGSSTAYFFAPFTDQPDRRGLLSEDMQPLSKYRAWIMRADEAGLQVCTHAIGDAGISAVLDLYGEVEAAHGLRDRRFRIEHLQHPAAKDFARLAALGVIASVQPTHAIDDGRWAEGRIGHDRASRSYALRTLADRGVRLAFGTDWPVAPLDPMLTLYAATTRATLDGKHPEGWFPEQKLTIEEAIAAHTLGSAYAEFQETEKGTIAPGKLADMVLLSEDVLAIRPAALRDVRVLTTWVGGVQVYPRPSPPGADARR